MLTHNLARNFVDYFALLVQFLAKRNQGHHDLQLSLHLLALYLTSGFKNCATLHARDFRKYQTQATAAENPASD